MCCLVKCLFQFFLILLNLCLLLVSATFVFFGVMITWFFDTLLSWFNNLLLNLTTEQKQLINQFLDYVQTYADGIGIVLLVIGGVIFVISLVGFLGLCFKNVCLTIVYSTLVGVLAAGVITIAVITIVDFSLILEPFSNEMSRLIRSEFDDPDNPSRQGSVTNIPPVTAGFITVIRQLQCCGVKSNTDFQEAKTWNRTYTYTSQLSQSVPLAVVPVMCCKNRNPVKSTVTTLSYYIPGRSTSDLDTTCMKAPTPENSYVTTCNEYLITVAAPIGWVLLGAGCFVILIFIGAVALTCSYKKRNSVGSYA